jgi:hypothetical protein
VEDVPAYSHSNNRWVRVGGACSDAWIIAGEIRRSQGKRVIAEEEVVSWSGAAEAFLRYTEHIKKHATSVLDRVANAAEQAGVPCDTIQVQDVQPYEGIIGHGPGLRSHRHGIARMQRTIRSCAWQCDKQGTDVH